MLPHVQQASRTAEQLLGNLKLRSRYVPFPLFRRPVTSVGSTHTGLGSGRRRLDGRGDDAACAFQVRVALSEGFRP